MRVILFIIQKELRQIRRTRAYFALIFLAPFLQLLIIGSAITMDVKNVPVAILDHDHSAASRKIREACAASASFELVAAAACEEQAVGLMDDGVAKIVLVIPPCFERDMNNGRNPSVQVLVDGIDGNSAGVALGYATSLLAGLQAEWMQGFSVSRQASLPASGRSPRIELNTRMWYNPNLESRLNFVPGLIGLLLILVTTFLTALNIVREKEIGTLEQLLVTPVTGLQLIVGKIVPFLILGFLQFTMSMVAAGLVFGIWMKGSLLLLYGMAALFCLSTLSLGIFVSTLANTQQQAMFIAWFLMIFSLLLSGLFVPIENTPPVIQAITMVNPLRYFVTIMREIYQKGTGLRLLWKEAAAMGAIGAGCLVSAALRFQKRLK
jgi:ABC-2 type transport system permease protein